MKAKRNTRTLCAGYDFVWATRSVAENATPVSFMFRIAPNQGLPSSGWVFLSEPDQRGIESAEDIQLVSLERILKHSPAVADYLHLPPGSQLEKQAGGVFVLVKKGKARKRTRSLHSTPR